ncbi:hypothetical protein D3C81_1738780 [compost metagenome]
MQMAATPRRRLFWRRADSKVTKMRAPEAPIGWPKAQAPPWILTLSCGRSRCFMAARVTTANASLISNKSTSARFQPVRFISLSMAPIGAVGNSAGASAKAACPWITAKGFKPRFSASLRRISTSAAAPSEIELALAAVTVPPSRKAGLSCGILSRRALGGCSSSLITRFSLPSVTSTGTISALKRPCLIAS